MEDPKNPHTGSSIETIFEENPSQEITQGGNEVRPRRGRPRNPETQTPNQIEANFQELIKNLEEQPEPELCDNTKLIEHFKKIIRQIQNILAEDFKMMSPKNIARVSTPNGMQKFEIGGLTKEQREHLRETLKTVVASVKILETDNTGNNGDSEGNMARLANDLYKGIPGLGKK